jgi:hypothetical protein
LLEYLPPEDCIKPDIEIENYRLQWDGSSFGVPRSEVQELKNMLRDIIPHITPAIYEAVGAVYQTIEKKAKDRKQARHIEEAFAPEILLTGRVGKGVVSYTLRMKKDGGTLVSRSESVSQGSAKVRVTWPLGELVFDRQK